MFFNNKVLAYEKYEDSNNFYYISYNSGHLLNEGFFAFVRLVINLNKCAIDGGCYEEEYQAEECIEDNNIISDDINNKVSNDNQKVTVANTLKTVSSFALIISLILIISGIVILGYNYYQNKNVIKKWQKGISDFDIPFCKQNVYFENINLLNNLEMI